MFVCIFSTGSCSGFSTTNSETPQTNDPNIATATSPTFQPQDTQFPKQTTTHPSIQFADPIDSGWMTLQNGLERRTIKLTSENGSLIESLFVLRIDPEFFNFNVFFEPDSPKDLRQWQNFTGALVVVNGGYFYKQEERYYANGLIIVEGQSIGISYGSYAGMLAITQDGPELRWLEQKPYDPEEPLLAGLQSFPLLVKPGGKLGFPAENEDYQNARRTVIGQDHQGNILLMIAPQGYFTLHQLSKFLTGMDLDLNIAINLDGGPSSGLLIADPYEEIPAYSLLPIVITVHPR